MEPIAQGLPASPGAASGFAVFDADRAEIQGKNQGQKVILLREETKPEDIHGFFRCSGHTYQPWWQDLPRCGGGRAVWASPVWPAPKGSMWMCSGARPMWAVG